MDPETPPLLALLLKTVEDTRIFDMSAPQIPVATIRQELREIFRQLYIDVSCQWNWMLYNDDELRNKALGLKLFLDHDELVGCGSEEFRDAIRLVADGEVETRLGHNISGSPVAREDRDFLYFMLGYMRANREEAIERLYRKP